MEEGWLSKKKPRLFGIFHLPRWQIVLKLRNGFQAKNPGHCQETRRQSQGCDVKPFVKILEILATLPPSTSSLHLQPRL